MTEKQFNHIENRIKEAAENSEFTFDEAAWIKMEARLDKEDNKRRRFLLWWILLPLLFIAAGSFYFFYNNSPSQKTTAAVKDQYITNSKSSQQKDNTSQTPSSINNQNIIGNKSSQQKNIPSVIPSSTDNHDVANGKLSQQKDTLSVTLSSIDNQQIIDSKSPQQKNNISLAPSSIDSQQIAKTKSSQQKNILLVTTPSIINAKNTNKEIDFEKRKTKLAKGIKRSVNKNNDVTTGFISDSSKKIKGVKKERLLSKTTAGGIDDTDVVEPVVEKADTILNLSSVNKISDDIKTDIPKDTIVKTDSFKNGMANNLPDKKGSGKKKEVNTSRFYLLGSIGADAGSVKLLSFKNNKITAKYGVGVGFQFNKKLSVQTGFYASRKKYIAGPGDYNPKRGSYWDTIRIVKVDASCLIYDIPLTVRYNVLQKANTNYYATAGISSFIMKKEDYHYHYFRNYIYNQSSWTYTGNKNFFAVLNFSAGIEKKLSPYFSIQAEPSVSIPVSGVGDGRVKLYSTALQLSVKYNPYRKHK